MELLRDHLLERIDGVSELLRLWFEDLAEVPLEKLQAPLVSGWGSIFGILAHVERDMEICLATLRGVPADTEDFYGSYHTLEELSEATLARQRQIFEVVASQADLREQVYQRFIPPDEGGNWIRAPFHRFVAISLEHSIQHLGHVDGLMRELGVKLRVNPLLEYVMAPPPGAYIRKDTYNYPADGSTPNYAPPAGVVVETWPDRRVPESAYLKSDDALSSHTLPRPPKKNA